MVRRIAKDAFEQEIQSGKQLVLVDFFADWCMPCRLVAPVVAEIAQKYEGRAEVVKFNVDEGPEMAAGYGVVSIPSLLLFENGQLVERLVGVQELDEICRIIDMHLT